MFDMYVMHARGRRAAQFHSMSSAHEESSLARAFRGGGKVRHLCFSALSLLDLVSVPAHSLVSAHNVERHDDAVWIYYCVCSRNEARK